MLAGYGVNAEVRLPQRALAEPPATRLGSMHPRRAALGLGLGLALALLTLVPGLQNGTGPGGAGAADSLTIERPPVERSTVERPPAAIATARPVLNSAGARSRGVPFGPGESLRYSIEYGVVKAGTATLEVGAMENYRGRECYHFTSRAESNDMMSKVYKVRDRIDSLVDAEGLYSYRYRKRTREGSYERDYDILYDPAGGRAKYADGVVMDMQPWSKDGLAAFYYVRFLPLTVGQDVEVAHHSDRRTNVIVVRVHRKERVEVPAGRFDCLVIEPMMEAGGIFKSSGQLLIYVTDDEHRVPVLMKSRIPVGSIDAVLTELRRGGPSGPAGMPGTTPAEGRADASGI